MPAGRTSIENEPEADCGRLDGLWMDQDEGEGGIEGESGGAPAAGGGWVQMTDEGRAGGMRAAARVRRAFGRMAMQAGGAGALIAGGQCFYCAIISLCVLFELAALIHRLDTIFRVR